MVPTVVEQLLLPDIELSPPLVLVNAGTKFAVNVLFGPLPNMQLPPAGTVAATVCAWASFPDRTMSEPTKTATPTNAARRARTDGRPGSLPTQGSRCPSPIHNSPVLASATPGQNRGYGHLVCQTCPASTEQRIPKSPAASANDSPAITRDVAGISSVDNPSVLGRPAAGNSTKGAPPSVRSRMSCGVGELSAPTTNNVPLVA